MKFIIASCIFFIVATADDNFTPKTFEEFTRIRSDCLSENNVPADLTHEIENQKYQNIESVRCYVKCASRKLEIWNEKNGYDLNRFYDTVVDAGKLVTNKDNLSKCFDAKRQDEDFCEWAYRNYMCVIDNNYVTKKN